MIVAKSWAVGVVTKLSTKMRIFEMNYRAEASVMSSALPVRVHASVDAFLVGHYERTYWS